MTLRVTLAGVGALLCAFAFLQSFDFPDIAGYFPRFAGAVGAVLAVFELARLGREALRRRAGTIAVDTSVERRERSEFATEAVYLVWFLGLIALIYLFGVFVAAAIWLPVYGATIGRIRWIIILSGVVSLECLMFGMRYIGFLQFPQGLLFDL